MAVIAKFKGRRPAIPPFAKLCFKLSKDICELGLAYGRKDKRGLRRNIRQIIASLKKLDEML